jgi:abortive infection bacteriophage resistance protein
MHIVINRIPMLMHQIISAIHNLKKFFAFQLRKYTLTVHKELSANILLSKKKTFEAVIKNPPGVSGGKIVLFK